MVPATSKLLLSITQQHPRRVDDEQCTVYASVRSEFEVTVMHYMTMRQPHAVASEFMVIPWESRVPES